MYIKRVSVLCQAILCVIAGGLIYTEKDWLGFSVNHLNHPNQSLKDGTSQLPAEYKLHGGHRFELEMSDSKKNESGKYVSVAFNYYHQLRFDQLDLGIYYTKNPFVIGIWYRGIPILKAYKPGYPNNDAIIFTLGFIINKVNIGYSYDLTISKLSNVSSGGAHEISLTYQFCTPKRKRKPILISCPKF